MNTEKDRFYQMLYIADGHEILLNRCSCCSNFSNPYIVGTCKHTPQCLNIDDCSYFMPLSRGAVKARLNDLMYCVNQ